MRSPISAHEWIARYARSLGQPPPDEDEISRLLDLAAEAAHSSERIAAPIACYLAGRDGRPLPELEQLAREVTGADEPPPAAGPQAS
jgi:hypothetical protein